MILFLKRLNIIIALIIIFISLTTPIKADLYKKLINQLEDGNKLIFIRHAYAPGNGDPDNFNLDDCFTQRNLNDDGKKQAKKIGEFFEPITLRAASLSGINYQLPKIK